jgi:hypothetical protein
MKGNSRIARIAAVIAITLGAVAAFALPAGADVGLMSPPIATVQIGSPATLGARGAIVTVPVTVLCAVGGSGGVSVDVTQAVGGNIAQGSGFQSVTCTGNFQTLSITVVANNHPFRTGPAFASASFVVCDNTGCLGSSDARQIRIRR